MMPNCSRCNSPTSSDREFCPFCGASIPESATTSKNPDHDLRLLLEQGKKIEAIKILKQRTGSSLKDAKDAVEAFQHDANLPSGCEPDDDLDRKVVQLMRQGEKLKAIQLYRGQTGATLVDSKRAVERSAERHGVGAQGTGCSNVLILFVVAAIAIAVVAVLVINQK